MTTAPQSPQQPNPVDSLKYAVVFASDQISAIQDRLAGAAHEVDPAVADWLDTLRTELLYVLAPFFPHRLAGTLPPVGDDGYLDVHAPAYLPLYADGRAPYDEVHLAAGVTAYNWNRPTGYPPKAAVDWAKLYPARPSLTIVSSNPTDGPQA